MFPPAESTALPFCSERCRTIDLGRWLGEAYRMPVDTEAEADKSPDGDDASHRNDVAQGTS
jgi:endogenous inhibitor of DNA gyrase (YacG/DUF329 family)